MPDPLASADRGSTDSRTDGERPLLLLVGSGAELYREYILRSVTSRYRLWLLDPQPPSWQTRYLAGSTVVDNTDPEALTAAAAVVAADLPVAGVLCYDEGLVWPAAHASTALGLTGSSPEAIRLCRDKRGTRERLDEAGIGQPRSICVADLDQARAAAGEIGYPVVLKPRGLAGSKGVSLVDGPSEIEAGYAAARAASYPGVPVYSAGVLVEEYLDGPEISIDAAFHGGSCEPLVIARKRIGLAPYFEETGHLVSTDDPLFADAAVTALLEQAHRALGVDHGVTHTEIRLTGRGPRLIEVNARLGGDLIPYLGLLANGTDCGLAAADIAAGRPPQPRVADRGYAGIRFFYPQYDVRVEDVRTDPTGLPAAVRQLQITAPAGTELRLPPRGYISRFGFAIAVADSDTDCAAALDRAEDAVELVGEQLLLTGAAS